MEDLFSRFSRGWPWPYVVLEVHIPKVAEAKAKTIEIKAA